MARTIEAKAVISAADKTGNVFDNIAKKIKGVEATAKSLSGIKPPQLMGEGFDAQLGRMRATERELKVIRKSWSDLDRTMRSHGGMAQHLDAIGAWKTGMISALRDSRAAMNEHERHQRRFYERSRHMVIGAAGMIGAGYVGERGIHAGVHAAAERSREMARYSLAGMTEEEKTRANAAADEIATRNPTISRTDVLSHIRQLRARLGSFDHAINNVGVVTRAQAVLGTIGHGEGAGEDLEKLTLALESQGLGSNPGKFADYMDAFVKAKSLFPDLRGEDFRQYMKASNSSKYALSRDYLTGVVPTMAQHEGASNFGVMQASAFSALIGPRQSAKSKAVMRQYGLMDKHDRLIDAKAFEANPRDWAENRLRTQLDRHGIKTDEEHRGDMVDVLTKMFSNRKVGEFFASMLVNKSVIDKDQQMLASAKGTEGADQARREDAFQAVTAISTQLKDAAAAFLKLQPVITGINAVADRLSKAVSVFDQADPAQKAGYTAAVGVGAIGAAGLAFRATSALYQAFTGMGALSAAGTSLQMAAAELTAAARVMAAGKVAGPAATAAAGGAAAAEGAAAGGASSALWGAGAAALPWVAAGAGVAGGLWAMHRSVEDAGYSGMTSGERLRQQRGGRSLREYLRHEWGYDQSSAPEVSPTMTWGTGVGGDKQVVAQLQGSAEVAGEAKIVVEAGSSLLDVVRQAQEAIRLTGKLNVNGPGSPGLSAPDTAAPATFTGVGAQPY